MDIEWSAAKIRGSWELDTGHLWEHKERTHNLETRGVCGGPEVGEVGHDRGLYMLAGLPWGHLGLRKKNMIGKLENYGS